MDQFMQGEQITNGVLVCTDAKKCTHKFYPLDKVMFNGRQLGDVLKDKDDAILALSGRLEKCETKLGLTSELAVLSAESREE